MAKQAWWLGAFALVILSGCGEADRVASTLSAQDDQAQTMGTATFNRDVAPVIFGHCAICHRPGESAPFSLINYSQVRKRARQISEVVESRFMPPWLPEPGYVQMAGERRLSDDQIDLIQQWVLQGAVEGDPSTRPEPPTFTKGWQLGLPDLVIRLPQPFVLTAEGTDVYRNFVIPIPIATSRYVKAVELRPGNPGVVHHAIMRIDRTRTTRYLDARDPGPGYGGMDMGRSQSPDGHLINWAPGKMPRPAREELSWRLGQNSDLVLQMHMLPTGKPESVDPLVGLFFTDQPPKFHSFELLIQGSGINIPAGMSDYEIKDRFVLPVDVEVLSVLPHAHYLGRRMDVFAELPGGGRRWLLHIKRWDFKWQDQYRYETPVVLPRGSAVCMHFTYDNSSANPQNPNTPPQRVVGGNRSTDEMGNVSLQVLTRNAHDRAILTEAMLRHALAKAPDSWQLVNSLGLALQELGRLDEAAGHFRHALQLRPGYAAAHNNLGVVLMVSGQWDEAAAHYRHAVELRPDYAEAHSNLGIVLARQDRMDEAVERHREALRLDPSYFQAHINLGNVRLGQEKLDAAIGHYRQVLQRRPDHAMAHNNLAVALRSKGAHEEALRHFHRALAADETCAEAHNNLGNVLQAQGETTDAVGHYRRALQIKDDYAEAHLNLGTVLVSMGRPDEAHEHFRHAVRHQPDFIGAHYNLAMSFQLRDQIDGALQHYGRVLVLDAEHADAHFGLANLLRRRNQFDLAMHHYRQALRFKPDDAETHYNLAQLLKHRGQISRAVQHYRQAVRLKPRWSAPLNNLAWILAIQPDDALGTPDEAVGFAQRAAEISKFQDPGILDSLAAALAAAGQFDQAVAVARQALGLASAVQERKVAKAIQEHLDCYRDGRPYRER